MKRSMSTVSRLPAERAGEVWHYDPKAVGVRLRRIRIVMGKRDKDPPSHYTQEEMADLFGIDQRHYSTFENRGSKPNAAVLTGIKNKFDVTSDWVLFGDSGDVVSKIANALEAVTSEEIDLTRKKRRKTKKSKAPA